MTKSDKTTLTIFLTALVTLIIAAIISGKEKEYTVIRSKKRVEPQILIYQQPDGKLDTTYNYQFLND